MDGLRQKFMRNVGHAVEDAYSPEGRALYGPQPSGNYADGPLPDYFAKEEGAAKVDALISGLQSAGALGMSAAGMPAAFGLPVAGISALGAATELGHSRDMGRAADMWSNTGLPQRPHPNEAIIRALMGRR